MSARAVIIFATLLILLFTTTLAQNLEAGFHGGLAVTGNQDYVPRGTEESTEYGVWVIFWPDDQLSIAADWAFIPQSDFTTTLNGFAVGERKRNRQYVDVTLQYHFWRNENQSVFAEIGGGSLWNNRDVFNPDGAADFEEAGKESTRFAVWTVGAGFRRRLLPHLNWTSQIKLHNPGFEERHGFRLFSGLTVSWR